jgi:hypothetical protein
VRITSRDHCSSWRPPWSTCTILDASCQSKNVGTNHRFHLMIQGDRWWLNRIGIIKDAWVTNGCNGDQRIYDWIHRVIDAGHERKQFSTDCAPRGKGIASIFSTHNMFFTGRLDLVSINQPWGVKTPLEDILCSHTLSFAPLREPSSWISFAVRWSSWYRFVLWSKMGYSRFLVSPGFIIEHLLGHRGLQNHGVIQGDVTLYRTGSTGFSGGWSGASFWILHPHGQTTLGQERVRSKSYAEAA